MIFNLIVFFKPYTKKLKNLEDKYFERNISQDNKLLSSKIQDLLETLPFTLLFKNQNEIFHTLGINLIKKFIYINKYSDFY